MSSWIVFGGEDQKTFLMASRRPQRANPRNTTNIVVRNGPAAPQGGANPQQQQRRKRRSRRRRGQASIRMPTVPTAPARPRRRQRPSSRIVYQQIVTTLGTVGSNNSDQIETEMAILLNPSTMKEATGSNSYGPLQIYASTYALFKMTSLELHLKPLVGASAVSGTIVRASWNPTNAPSQISWSALGARKHADTTPGRPGRFRLSAADLKGPKDGWYKTNTKGDPMLSFAGSLEVHSLGKTMSTYQSKDFTGGLFLAELKTTWAFKDYSQQPGFMNLVKGDSSGDARVQVAADNTIQLVTGAQTRLARVARAETPTVSEIIWMVTDTIIDAGAGAFPAPFNWLFRGGWWFLKRIAGAPVRAGEVTFQVYSSINDARANVPCVATSIASTPVNVESLHFQQITPGSVGIAEDIPLPTVERVVAGQSLQITTAQRYTFNSTTQMVDAYPVYYIANSLGAGVGFRNGSAGVYTANLIHVTCEGFVPSPGALPVFIRADGGTTTHQVGLAHYSAHSVLDDGHAVLDIYTVLFQAFADQQLSVTRGWRGLYIQYPTSDYKIKVHVPQESQGSVRVAVIADEFYLMQFCCYRSPAQAVQRVYAGTMDIAVTATQMATTEHVFDAAPMPGVLAYTSFDFKVIDGDLTFEDEAGESRIVPVPDGDLSDEDSDLEMADDDHYSDPPLSALGVEPQAQSLYDILKHDGHSEREARMAVNQLFPSESFVRFNEIYHDRIVDGFSPAAARRYAMGL
nr:capsid protein [Water buffalo astrovirus]